MKIIFSLVIAFVGGLLANIIYSLSDGEQLILNMLTFISALYLQDRQDEKE